MEELLIKKVKEREFLFDVKSPKYKDRNVRQEAWEEIGKELNMKPEQVKEKWLKLRRCFTNALNRRRWKEHGHPAKKIVSWKFGKQMSFLLPHLDCKKQTTNVEAIDLKVEEDSTQSITDIHRDDQEMDFADEKNLNISDDQGDTENQHRDFMTQKNRSRNAHTSQHLDNRETDRRLADKDENPNQEIVRLLAENSSIHQFMFPEKSPKISNKLDFGELDDSDMFYLSMSKMAKRLPLVSQAKIKLLLSQAVLEAEIANAGKQLENVMASLSAGFVSTADFQSSSAGGDQ